MIKQVNVLDVQDAKGELYLELMESIVPDFEGGQNSYIRFDLDFNDEGSYPHLEKFLKDNNLNEILILIHW